MGAALASGLRVAGQRWSLVLVLFLVNLGCGLVFTTASWSWLAMALGESLATRTLHADLDANVFVDLFVHHAESLRMLLLSGGVLALLFALLGVWLNAVTVVAVAEDGNLGEAMRRGLHFYGTFLHLWILASLLYVAGAAAAFVLGRGLARWAAESPAEMTVYWVGAALAAVGALLLLFLSVVHDHARIRVAATGAGAGRAYAWAMNFVVVRERRALPLAAVLLAMGGAVWAVYQTVGKLMTTTSGPGLTVSLVWGEMLLLARMSLRVWLFAAETDLQSLARDEGR
jgi:hypothetical protein